LEGFRVRVETAAQYSAGRYSVHANPVGSKGARKFFTIIVWPAFVAL
jgi:hypothetical protein